MGHGVVAGGRDVCQDRCMTSSGDVIVKTKEDDMHYSVAIQSGNFVIDINGEKSKYSDIESLYTHVLNIANDAVFIRDDVMNDSAGVNALHDFDSMDRSENRVIHARAHSRRNAFRECAYCVREFISPEEYLNEIEKDANAFVRPIHSRMSHDSCAHESSKSARAKCRRERRNAKVNSDK